MASTITLEVSRDGGRTYGSPMERTVSDRENPGKFAEWRRLGQGRDWVFKVSCSGKVALLNCWVETEVAAK